MDDNEKQTEKSFLNQKLVTPIMALALAVCCVGVTAAAFLWMPTTTPTPTVDELYHASVMDSITVEADEILPLVTINEDSDMVTWKDGKVLMLSMHYRPERYVAGSPLTLPSGVWTFTDKEMYAWYKDNKTGVTDWPMRFRQLIGAPPDKIYTHVSGLWVSPADLVRPAYSTDIAVDAMAATLPENVSERYKLWFNDNIIWSYFTSPLPWTRLGYTYDWADNGDEYGLSEFWAHPAAEVTVEFTDTLDEFILRLEQSTK